MTLPTPLADGDQVRTGPGYIFLAVEGTPEPTWTASGSKFTNAFNGAWKSVGYTEEGLTITIGVDTEDVVVDEEADPIRTVPTKRTGSVEFSLASLNQANIEAAFSGGTWSASGSGASQIAAYTPPDLADVERRMLIWLSAAEDEVFVVFKAFQAGEIKWVRKKGSTIASLSGFKYLIEKPDSLVSANPWKYLYAGVGLD